ncbi:MAG: TIGR00341 family protein, partial [Chloroflexi bacterium]|nr:TIGR00341 family protein [Chloroflexota bacterium]
QMEENRRRIAQTLAGLEFSRPPEQKVVIADSVVEGIVEEAGGYDLVLLGASEEGLFDQFVFGSIPQQIAARVPKTAIMVRRYGGPTEFWIRKLMRGLSHLFPRLSVEEQLELREAMSNGAQPGVNYFVLIVLSCIIATLGLLLNSGAVIIGAMLVAPLMSPILAFSLGLVLGDVRLIRLSIEAGFKGVALAIIIAVFIGVFSPFKGLTDEIMARTQPTLLDLAVALASGMAGAYALARKDVSAALPGVAIAAALMPPLGAVGLGLSLGNAQVAGGAFLLFITNVGSISLAGAIVFTLLGVRPQTWRAETRRQIWRRLSSLVLLLLVIAVPLAVIMGGVVRDTAARQVIREVLEVQIASQGGELDEFEYRADKSGVVVVATMRSVHPLDQATVDTTATALSGRLGRPVTLDVVVLPVTSSRGQ